MAPILHVDGAEPEWFNLCHHLQSQDINPQASSPFFNGHAPAEIRNFIFEFALTGSPDPKARRFKIEPGGVRFDHDPAPTPQLPVDPPSDSKTTRRQQTLRLSGPLDYRYRRSRPERFSRRAENGFDWLRPDNTDRMRVATALLLTCRRVYLETHSLPLQQKEHVFYCAHGPDHLGLQHPSSNSIEAFFHQLNKPTSVPGLLQKDLVRSIRLFTQQSWLENTFLGLTQAPNWFNSVHHLRITLRRGDWWHWQAGETLRINPFRGNCHALEAIDDMYEDMVVEGSNPAFADDVWGQAFANMPQLRTLTIDFETSEFKKSELETIVDWAANWRFPLSGGRHLATEEVMKMSWRGTLHHWRPFCEAPGHWEINPTTPCAACVERGRLVANGYGPRLYVWTVIWKPADNK
ncbi:Uu.00g049170.m01.CDS01 [Anthostomella pinea]|uniref:Uu.00g049170.m01.CDS01 n=1 Tax=Anthostomella pinea TaxID=933095 RepID=A0AAI8YCC8_9PEZI|nr:Uu.00g049170.m01.CDS01 [Anthostomella pinea]